ncbi:MAG: tocopherol cyclase family protein [Clostridiaceae bacterium]
MLRKTTNPILFQGNLKKKNYFEGWYYKQVSKDEKNVVCFIPGISLSNNEAFSFVQYVFLKLDKNNNRIVKTGYKKYSIDEFKVKSNPFILQIGENVFSETEINIKLNDNEDIIEGTLKLGAFQTIERSILVPNIMGPLAYLPKMECNHGVISMRHQINGIIKINDEEIDFSGGKGYIEKDWGTSFPEKYMWIQCNNFGDKTISIFSSVAKLPYMGIGFKGHVSNVLIGEKQYRFATYNNSKLRIEKISGENIKLILENSKAMLKIEATLKEPVELIAPKAGKMEKKIKEDTGGIVKFRLYDKISKNIYEDTGNMAGIEIVGFNKAK